MLATTALLVAAHAIAAGDDALSLPCAYSGALQQSGDGQIARFTSEQMKKRAVRRVELPLFIRQADIKAQVAVDLVVDESGRVHCLKPFSAHPLVRKSVEEALRDWTFQRMKDWRGRPVGYVGRLEFTLCNISCGPNGPSMTLLR